AAAVAAPSTGATAARPLFAGLGLVDGQGPAADILAVEGGDGLLAPLAHLHEAEAPRAAGVPVADDLGAGDRAVRREQLAQVVGGGLEGQVADVDVLLAHALPPGPEAPLRKLGCASPWPRTTNGASNGLAFTARQ